MAIFSNSKIITKEDDIHISNNWWDNMIGYLEREPWSDDYVLRVRIPAKDRY